MTRALWASLLRFFPAFLKKKFTKEGKGNTNTEGHRGLHGRPKRLSGYEGHVRVLSGCVQGLWRQELIVLCFLIYAYDLAAPHRTAGLTAYAG